MPDTVLAQSVDLIPDRLVRFVWRPERSTGQWYAFYIIAPGKKRLRGAQKPAADRKYHGGWNGERVARHTDMVALRKQHPQVYQWMLGVLKDVAA